MSGHLQGSACASGANEVVIIKDIIFSFWAGGVLRGVLSNKNIRIPHKHFGDHPSPALCDFGWVGGDV